MAAISKRFISSAEKLAVYGPASAPRVFNASRAELLDSSEPLEEERLCGLSGNKIQQYYPVKIGDVLHTKFQVLGKLGYGVTSTVWLCRDLWAHSYVVTKIYIHESRRSDVNNELKIYKHLASAKSQNPPALRKVLDDFTITSPHGDHHCIVHDPLTMSLQWLRRNIPSHMFPEHLIKSTTTEILKTLKFLHDDADITHTDLKAANFLHTIEDDTLLPNFEAEELETPSPYKIVEDNYVYESRELGIPRISGDLVLIDFGESRIGAQKYTQQLQPEVYRAPEVLLQMDWDHKIDIWNLACMIWDLYQGQFLFDTEDEDGNYSKARHLAEITAYLGTPPLDFLQRSSISSDFFNDDGTLKHDKFGPLRSLEEAERVLDPAGREVFLSFMRAALHWDPEHRKSASELLTHPWLQDRQAPSRKSSESS